MVKNLHLVLVLYQKLDSLNGGSGGLGDGSGDTSHEEVGHEGTEVLGLGWVGHDADLLVLNKDAWSETFKTSGSGFEARDEQKKTARSSDCTPLHCCWIGVTHSFFVKRIKRKEKKSGA
jgi:hypothetical protein